MIEPTWLLDLFESISPMIAGNVSGIEISSLNVGRSKADNIDGALIAVRQYLTESFPGEEITSGRPEGGLAWEFSVVRHNVAEHTVRIMRRFIDDHREAWTTRLTGWDLARHMREVGVATVIVDSNGLTRGDV